MTRSEFTVADAYSYDHRSTLRWLQSHILRYPSLWITFFLTTVGMAGSQSRPDIRVGRALYCVIN
jgi:hypothetical protein